jgi:O-antigen ligase
MIQKADKVALERILMLTALLATLIVTPWSSYDPINAPKLAVIAIGGFMAAGVLASNISVLKESRIRFIVLLAGMFLFNLFAVLLLSGNNIYQSFFGTFGRSTGFVAYVSLALLLLAASFVSNKTLIQKFSFALLGAGFMSSIYGVLQSLNVDFFNWVNQYSPVIGFLGNPNFQSSFVGFSGITAFAYLLSVSGKSIYKIGATLYLALSVYVIQQTDSQQGFLVLLGGIGIVLLIWIPKSRIAFLKFPAFILGFLGVLLISLGSINKGPSANILYKASVTYRGDYWQAGWKMTTDNPFLGIGLDSYGDWYRRARTVEATLRRGPDVTSNAAHNVLLDFSSNGGFPLLLIYLALVVYVIHSVVKILKRSTEFNAPLAGLIAVWFAYMAQSIISLNQLGLAIWGWIISGLLIGYEINTRNPDPAEDRNSKIGKGRIAKTLTESKISPKTLLSVVSGLIIGALLGLPPLVASSQHLSALKSQDAKRIEQAAYIWPLDPNRMGQIAISLANSNFQKEALEILIDGSSKFPDEYQMWRLISEIPNATPEQVNEARRQMKRLDPFNPNLK